MDDNGRAAALCRAHAFTFRIIDNMNYAHEHGTDRPEVANWTWPY